MDFIELNLMSFQNLYNRKGIYTMYKTVKLIDGQEVQLTGRTKNDLIEIIDGPITGPFFKHTVWISVDEIKEGD